MEWINKSCADFVGGLASGNATPGGGSTAALVGSLGAALGSMVGNLTIGRKAYLTVEEDMLKLCKETEVLQKELLSLVQEDVNAFNALMSAYRLPKESDDEKKFRSQEIQKCTIQATEVPLKIIDTCAKVFPLLTDFVEKGNPNAISDGACGAIFCRAAIEASIFNVYINLGSIKDPSYINEKLSHAEEVKKHCTTLTEEIVTRAREQLL